ncbi:Pentatricopeptide repeat-containing protein [Acorus calamus]|uniref:Pentatricopeptide repeat-containing protein n=1 Tax=Acorus calamus TaxID=4465 RepID=A0AAV9FG85_ACOCL|nr:Pentatricopeptide repeat-containing protein [Acorus calamus]
MRARPPQPSWSILSSPLRRPFPNPTKPPSPSRYSNGRRSDPPPPTRSFSSSPSLPPPEWIDPFIDVSDLNRHSSDLHQSPWVARIAALLDSSPTMESDLTAFCHSLLIRLSPAFVSHLLRSSDSPLRRDPAIAVRFFRWAGRQRRYVHKLESYTSLIEILLSSDTGVEKIRPLVLEIEEYTMTIAASNSLIRSLGKVGMVEELLEVWRWMKRDGLEPSLFSYNCLLDGLVSSGFIDSAERVFEVMKAPPPDIVAFNTMIKGYCKVGKTRKAIELMREMDSRVGGPDKISYMTVIQACYSDGDFDACLRLYHEMEERGLEIPVHAYSLVIGGLCKGGKPFEGLSVFEKMIERGCKRNVAIYTALIDSFAKSGSEDRAMNLFFRLKNENEFELDDVAYGVVVNLLCKAGKLEEAVEQFEYCKEKGVSINMVIYCSLIDGFGKVGRVDKAERLFEEMVNGGIVPDSYCYNAIIDALTKHGRIDEALDMFRRMESEGCDQTVYTYTILIDGLFRKHRNEEALKLWRVMIDKGITPTAASFRVLSKGLCLSGKFETARKIVDDLAPMGVVLETAYVDMIHVLCKAGRVRHACRLADGIIERGREIPGNVRKVMINALRKAGNADLAIKLLHSKIGIGYDRMGSVKRRVKFQTLLNG